MKEYKEVITLDLSDIEEAAKMLDERFNQEGQSWHVFGRCPESGYMVVDNGCAGNWHTEGWLAELIVNSFKHYGITIFSIYSEPYKFASLENADKYEVVFE